MLQTATSSTNALLGKDITYRAGKSQMHYDNRLFGLDKTQERPMKAVVTPHSRHNTGLPKMLDFLGHEDFGRVDIPKAPKTV